MPWNQYERQKRKGSEALLICDSILIDSTWVFLPELYRRIGFDPENNRGFSLSYDNVIANLEEHWGLPYNNAYELLCCLEDRCLLDFVAKGVSDDVKVVFQSMLYDN